MTSDTAFMQCDALVLAGARNAQDPVADAANVGHKALAEIAGRPMIAWVIDALLESPRIRRIFVSAPTDELLNDAGLRKYHEDSAIQFTQSGGNPGDSVALALEDKSIGSPLLVTTCDNPLLSLESIEELAHMASTNDIDLAVGLAHETAVSGVQPDGKRTYLRFRDGGYSGCNLFLFKTWESRRVAEFWGSIDSVRKAPRKIVGAFGLGAVLLFLFRRLPMRSAISYAGRKLGVEVIGVTLRDGRAAVDVDKASDLELVRRLVKERAAL